MMKFATEACEVQRRGGSFFTLCEDDRARCWHETGAAVLSDKPGVDRCTVDLCTYGLKAHDALGNGAGVRRVRTMSNMATIIKSMPRRGIGDHRHIGCDQQGAVVDQGLHEPICRHLVKCIDVHITGECTSDNMALTKVAESDGAHDVTDDDWRMYV